MCVIICLLAMFWILYKSQRRMNCNVLGSAAIFCLLGLGHGAEGTVADILCYDVRSHSGSSHLHQLSLALATVPIL